MVLGIQIIGVLFGMFMLYLTFLNFKRKEYKSFEFFFWAFVWVLMLFFTIFPHIVEIFVKSTLNLTRPLDFYIIGSLLFLVGLGFFVYNKVKRMEAKVEQIVREVAIKRK